MSNIIENAFLLGLGVASLSAKKAKEFVDKAVGDKDVTAEEGNQLLKTLIEEGQKAHQTLEDKVIDIIKSKGTSLLPTDPRLAALEARVAELEKKLAEKQA